MTIDPAAAFMIGMIVIMFGVAVFTRKFSR